MMIRGSGRDESVSVTASKLRSRDGHCTVIIVQPAVFSWSGIVFTI